MDPVGGARCGVRPLEEAGAVGDLIAARAVVVDSAEGAGASEAEEPVAVGRRPENETARFPSEAG